MHRKTIVIPTYNAENTIDATLRSVVNNQPRQYGINTVFIADDCSNDNTLEICVNYEKESNFISVIKSELNRGERGNLNQIIQTIKNDFDWVLILHADDLAKDNWLEVMCNFINSSTKQVASISSSYDVLWENGNIDRGEEEAGTVSIIGSKSSIRSTLKSGTWWHISGCAINISSFLKSGSFNEKMPQYGDMEWILRIFQLEYEVIYVPKSLTIYRQSANSISSISFKTHRDIYELVNLIKHYSKLFNAREIIDFYIKLNLQLFKRNIRSLIKGDFSRLKSSLKMTIYIIKVFCFKQKPDMLFDDQKF